jgi:hypothetical protein
MQVGKTPPQPVTVISTNLLTGRRSVSARLVNEWFYLPDPAQPGTALIAGPSCADPAYRFRGSYGFSQPQHYQLLTGVDYGPPKRCPVTISGPLEAKASELTLRIKCTDGCVSTIKLDRDSAATHVKEPPSTHVFQVSVKLAPGPLQEAVIDEIRRVRRCSARPHASGCRVKAQEVRITTSTTNSTGLKTSSTKVLTVKVA